MLRDTWMINTSILCYLPCMRNLMLSKNTGLKCLGSNISRPSKGSSEVERCLVFFFLSLWRKLSLIKPENQRINLINDILTFIFVVWEWNIFVQFKWDCLIVRGYVKAVLYYQLLYSAVCSQIFKNIYLRDLL